MLNRYSAKMSPVLVGALSTWMLTACGAPEVDQIEEKVTVSKAAVLNQHDFDGFLTGINLKSCSFSIAGGTGQFTPSNELSKVLYGDSNGAAHKKTFAVPVISSSSFSVTITSLNAEMASTGISLSGNNANVKVAFDGLLHASIKVPIIGNVSTDLKINPSSITVALIYDKTAERAKVGSVVSALDTKAQKCGGFLGLCNGAVDSYLKTNLPALINGPLADVITDALDSADATDGLYTAIGAAYNLKDPSTPAWTVDAHSLSLASSQFSFNVTHP
jgi:hypothetical protein